MVKTKDMILIVEICRGWITKINFPAQHSSRVLPTWWFYYASKALESAVYCLNGARGKFGENETSVRVARGDSKEQLQLLECLDR